MWYCIDWKHGMKKIDMWFDMSQQLAKALFSNCFNRYLKVFKCASSPYLYYNKNFVYGRWSKDLVSPDKRYYKVLTIGGQYILPIDLQWKNQKKCATYWDKKVTAIIFEKWTYRYKLIKWAFWLGFQVINEIFKEIQNTWNKLEQNMLALLPSVSSVYCQC